MNIHGTVQNLQLLSSSFEAEASRPRLTARKRVQEVKEAIELNLLSLCCSFSV